MTSHDSGTGVETPESPERHQESSEAPDPASMLGRQTDDAVDRLSEEARNIVSASQAEQIRQARENTLGKDTGTSRAAQELTATIVRNSASFQSEQSIHIDTPDIPNGLEHARQLLGLGQEAKNSVRSIQEKGYTAPEWQALLRAFDAAILMIHTRVGSHGEFPVSKADFDALKQHLGNLWERQTTLSQHAFANRRMETIIHGQLGQEIPGVPADPERECVWVTKQESHLIDNGITKWNNIISTYGCTLFDREPERYGNTHVLKALIDGINARSVTVDDLNPLQREDRARRRKGIMAAATAAIEQNLGVLRSEIDAQENGSHDQQNLPPGMSLGQLKEAYGRECRRFTELLAATDVSATCDELTNPALAVKYASEAMAGMSIDEGIRWMTDMDAGISKNWKWRGEEAKAYTGVFQACREVLKQKIAAEEQSANGEQQRVAKLDDDRLRLAEMNRTGLTVLDQGSPMIGLGAKYAPQLQKELCNNADAASWAEEAMHIDELADRYAQRHRQDLSNFPMLKSTLTVFHDLVEPKLPQYLVDHPEQRGKVDEWKRFMTATPPTIELAIAQYTLAWTLGRELNPQLPVQVPDIPLQVRNFLVEDIRNKVLEFKTFLDGDWKGAAGVKAINAAIGDPPLTPTQIRAHELLSGIEGFGYALGDDSRLQAAAYAQVGVSIAAGVAIGMATAGLGTPAAMAIGGAAMTGLDVAMEKREQTFAEIGAKFAINGTSFGLGHAVIDPMRAVVPLIRAGVIRTPGEAAAFFAAANSAQGRRLVLELGDALFDSVRSQWGKLGGSVALNAAEGAANMTADAAMRDVLLGQDFHESFNNASLYFLAGSVIGGEAFKQLLRSEHGADAGLRVIRSIDEQHRSICNIAVGSDVDIARLAKLKNFEEVRSVLQGSTLSPDNQRKVSEAWLKIEQSRRPLLEILVAFGAGTVPDIPAGKSPLRTVEKDGGIIGKHSPDHPSDVLPSVSNKQLEKLATRWREASSEERHAITQEMNTSLWKVLEGRNVTDKFGDRYVIKGDGICTSSGECIAIISYTFQELQGVFVLEIGFDIQIPYQNRGITGAFVTEAVSQLPKDIPVAAGGINNVPTLIQLAKTASDKLSGDAKKLLARWELEERIANTEGRELTLEEIRLFQFDTLGLIGAHDVAGEKHTNMFFKKTLKADGSSGFIIDDRTGRVKYIDDPTNSHAPSDSRINAFQWIIQNAICAALKKGVVFPKEVLQDLVLSKVLGSKHARDVWLISDPKGQVPELYVSQVPRTAIPVCK